MAGRNVLTKQSALKLASDRRRELDRARGEQDKRIEEATASTLVALQVREDAERALEAAQAEVGESLRKMLAEDVSVERAAALLDLDVTEVRRLMKAAPTESETAGGSKQVGSVTALPDASGSDSAARQTG
ncbi:hypothetical protein [uncultured Jatrophihabitans sp.]|uniref:hypothetical protein n=1 Tax=uncultured Jatrophihabitans sp. TaxID=1610747 RepID=UPI0035CB3525